MAIHPLLINKPQNDADWELWCKRIFQHITKGLVFQRYKLPGANQNGIDLYATDRDGKVVAVQCKKRNRAKTVTEKDATADLAHAKKHFRKLKAFYIATTHESTDLQDWAIETSTKRLQVGVYAWGKIEDELRTNPALYQELAGDAVRNDSKAELAYTRALIDLRDKMNLYALEKAAAEVREPPLTAAYVPLELSEVTRTGNEPELVGGSYSIEQVMDSLHAKAVMPTYDALPASEEAASNELSHKSAVRSENRSNVLLLVGEAGRGKTTLLRYIAVEAAKARRDVLASTAALPEFRIEPRALSWKERVPFYREVRLATKERPIEDLNQLACEILPSNPQDVAVDWARRVVKTGRALILLDGVDEVPDDGQRTTLLANINVLIKQNPETLFVVSSRPGAAEGLRRALAAFTPREARVQALGGTSLSKFIQHWHGAVQRVAEELYTGHGRTKRVTEINEALATLPAKLDAARHIKALMATPLLAALVCAYHLDYKSLPDNQTKLMTSLAVCLIDYHDRQRPGMPAWPAYSKLDENDKLNILEAIAAEMVHKLSPTITCDTDVPGGTDAFDRHIRNFMKTAPWLQKPDLRDLRGGLKDRTGVLHELQRGVLSFIHNEFRDFLAARHMVPMADKPQVYKAITETLADRDWHGLIFFAITADRDKQRKGVADKLVNSLLNIVNNPPTALLAWQFKTMAEKQATDAYLSLRRVAFRLGGAKPPVTAKAFEALQKVRKAMLPPSSMEDAEIVSELGINAISDLRYDPKLDTATRAACTYSLRLIDHPDANAARRDYAQQETDWNVLFELVQTIPIAEIPFIARGITEPVEGFNLPDEMHTRLIRQASGLVKGVPPGPARTLVRRLKVLQIRTDDEALGLFHQTGPVAVPFAATQVVFGNSTGSAAAITALAARDLGLQALSALDLSGTQVTDAAVAVLAAKDSGLKGLNTLDLSGTQLTDLGAKPLASKDSGLRALNSLNLSDTHITDAAVAVLAAKESGLKGLTTLNLSRTQITDAALAVLAAKESGLRGLTTLDLGLTLITDAGAKSLAAKESGLKGLTTLNLDFTQITDAWMKVLTAKESGLKGLTTLSLEGTEITDAGAAVLAAKESGLKALTTLNLSVTQITNAGVAAIKARYPGIKIIR